MLSFILLVLFLDLCSHIVITDDGIKYEPRRNTDHRSRKNTDEHENQRHDMSDYYNWPSNSD